ncbi:hypothetical protein [Chlamydiifrater volucris]|uniref:hypothetical protein n=1 Tax=Chlamydiifrater volucris TaxID=2681470 RepID=UPI001BD06398|nr:hypothetical protein [Chlamydiifrater volucris]
MRAGCIVTFLSFSASKEAFGHAMIVRSSGDGTWSSLGRALRLVLDFRTESIRYS